MSDVDLVEQGREVSREGEAINIGGGRGEYAPRLLPANLPTPSSTFGAQQFWARRWKNTPVELPLWLLSWR